MSDFFTLLKLVFLIDFSSKILFVVILMSYVILVILSTFGMVGALNLAEINYEQKRNLRENRQIGI